MGGIELMGGRGMWPVGRKWEQVMGLLHNSMVSPKDLKKTKEEQIN